MRILGLLADRDTASVCFAVVAFVSTVLKYRVRRRKIDSEHHLGCLEIDLLREERGLNPVSQPSEAVRARHARRRRIR